MLMTMGQQLSRVEPDWDFFGGRLAWIEAFPEVRGWYDLLEPGTAREYSYKLYRFFRWVYNYGGVFAGKTPGELLGLQEVAVGRAQWDQVRLLQFFVNNVIVGARSTKLGFMSAIGGFYRRNYVLFPSDPNFRVVVNRERSEGFLLRGEIRNIMVGSPVFYRVAYAVMAVGFMGFKGFDIFNRSEEVRRAVLEETDYVQVNLPPRKRGRYSYWTVVGGDGLKLLREYFDSVRGDPKRGEALVLNTRGRPLTRPAMGKNFRDVAVALGLIELNTPLCPGCGGRTMKDKRYKYTDVGQIEETRTHYVCQKCGLDSVFGGAVKKVDKGVRYRAHPHELRDWSKTMWYRSGTPEKWMADFFMGHIRDVDKNNYMKAMRTDPEWVIDTYLENIAWLNVYTANPEIMSAREGKRLQTEYESVKEALERYRELPGVVEELSDRLKELERDR